MSVALLDAKALLSQGRTRLADIAVAAGYPSAQAFLFTAATPAVLILAGAFVVTGLFVPRLWCHTFCPVGELFSLAETSSKKNNPKK